MPLFRDSRQHTGRSIAAACVAVFASHAAMRIIPHTVQAFTLTQTSVAMLAIAALMVFIVTHHRRNGQILSQFQEEAILVSAFGVFWFAILMGWRAMNQSMHPGRAGELSIPSAAPSPRRESGFTGARRPWPCSSDDVYCVVEEWSYF